MERHDYRGKAAEAKVKEQIKQAELLRERITHSGSPRQSEPGFRCGLKEAQAIEGIMDALAGSLERKATSLALDKVGSLPTNTYSMNVNVR